MGIYSHRGWCWCSGGKLLSTNQTSVLREIIAKPNRSSKGLSRSIEHLDHSQVTRDALCKKEFIRFEDKVNNGPKSKIKIAVLNLRESEFHNVSGARSIAAINAIHDAGGEIEINELARLEGPTIKDAVRRLSKKARRIPEREDRRSADFKHFRLESTLQLNDQQQAAFDAMCSGHTIGASRTYLLHGVTGAGKQKSLQAA